MNKNNNCGQDVKARAIDSKSLETRLELNQKYQSKNFHDWLHQRLNVSEDEHILDVGCGTGAQSLRFLEALGEQGTVSAIDISSSSVEKLLEVVRGDNRLEAFTADMADLNKIIEKKFKQKKFTLAHSTYALYYSPSRLEVIKHMADAIYNFGRLAVFTPAAPHGMVEIASRFSSIPAAVLESLEFGPAVLEPELRSLFWEVEVHFFQSEMRVTALEDFINFYRATTYFDASVTDQVRLYAQKEIRENGFVKYEKNGYLIIGRDKKPSLEANISPQ